MLYFIDTPGALVGLPLTWIGGPALGYNGVLIGRVAMAGLAAQLFARELAGAFKTPTLRYLGRTAPYMHAGQFQTLEDVIWQYRDVPPATVGVTELKRLPMSDAQFRQIEDFLRTLDGPIRAPAHFLKPPD